MLKDDVDVTKSISEAMDAGDGYFAERYSTRSDDEIIGGGSLFTDKVLQPNETIARTKVIYLPKRTYDLVRVGIRIPTAGTNPKAKLTINWKMIDKFPREVLTKIDENGNKHRIDPDEDGQYSVNPLEFQMAGGEAELALGR